MPDVPQGSIIITPEQMYQQTNQQFGQITETLSQLRQDLHPLVPQVAEHDLWITTQREAGLIDRVSRLEAASERAHAEIDSIRGRLMWILGAGAALAFVGGLLGGFLPSLVK